jgi:hypothetical protein
MVGVLYAQYRPCKTGFFSKWHPMFGYGATCADGGEGRVYATFGMGNLAALNL